VLDLEDQWQRVLMVVALLMSRMLVALSVVPLFVGNTIPGMVRVLFVGGLAVSLLPMAYADANLSTIPLISMPYYIAKEAALGLALGLLASVGFWALYAAGALIEYQAGLSFAATFDPMTPDSESLLGSFLMRLFMTLFLVSGGLLALISMLFDSYAVWPLSSMAPAAGSLPLVELMLRSVGALLALALKVAVPFLILMLMIEIGLGLLSRFAPQLNVFFVALSVKVLALAAMLLLYGMVVASSGSLLPVADFTQQLRALQEALR
jgi:type III secretion protein T